MTIDEAIKMIPKEPIITLVCDDWYSTFCREGVVSRIKQKHLPKNLKVNNHFKNENKVFEIEGERVVSRLVIHDVLEDRDYFVITGNGEQAPVDSSQSPADSSQSVIDSQQSFDNNKNERLIEKKFEMLEQKIENEEQGSISSPQPEIDKELEDNTEQGVLTVEMIKEFLDRFDIDEKTYQEYEKSLLYLAEFAIEDENWWDEGMVRRYYLYLKNNHNLDDNRIRQIAKPVGWFFDWLKDKGIVRFNPIRVMKWKRDG